MLTTHQLVTHTHTYTLQGELVTNICLRVKKTHYHDTATTSRGYRRIQHPPVTDCLRAIPSSYKSQCFRAERLKKHKHQHLARTITLTFSINTRIITAELGGGVKRTQLHGINLRPGCISVARGPGFCR